MTHASIENQAWASAALDAEKRVRAYLTENFLLGADASLDSTQSLLRSGVLDSTGVMELIIYLETTFQITVDDSEVVPANLDSIRNIVEFLGRKHAAKSSGG